MANYTVNFPEIPDSSTWIFLSPFVDKVLTFDVQGGHLTLNYEELRQERGTIYVTLKLSENSESSVFLLIFLMI